MLDKLYPYRFKVFFFSQVSLLFSSLVVPATLHEGVISPILLFVNLAAGVLFTAKKKRVFWFLITLFIITVAIVSFSLLEGMDKRATDLVRMGTAFLFYAIVSLEIIKQVWSAVSVNGNVILGLISGYLSLGLIGSFICTSIEIINPGSFKGLSVDPNLLNVELNYYSYITLLTIGYGDIVPVTNLARTTSVLIGLMGQMYIVIITAVVVGKYINQSASEIIE